jgi:predicted dehydrogenase
MTDPVRFGMVGGGPGAFIGDVHRMAATLDGELVLVAGAFSSDAARSREKGRGLGLDPQRVYGSWREMAERESALPAEQRIEAVAIVTPNHLHHPVASAFLDAGFHVFCDKPLTNTVDEAEDLCRRVADTGRVFVLTHNYTGYPMVKEARALAREGRLGEVRKVVAEYPQGWLTLPLEAEGQKQAAWRTDPARGGVALALGDIGSHAENLARYVTGLEIEELCADLTSFVPGRVLEDDANLLIRYAGGARGVLYASQISVGEENGLALRVYGTEGSIAWRQEAPNELHVRSLDGPEQVLRRGNAYLSDAAQVATRIPPGHPEGFIEAFANLYRAGAAAIRDADAEEREALDFPTVWDGARGVHFIHKAVESARANGWVGASYTPPHEPPGDA